MLYMFAHTCGKEGREERERERDTHTHTHTTHKDRRYTHIVPYPKVSFAIK